MPGAAIPTVQVDDERVRVTEWRFPPGTATGWHRHEHDYVVVPVTNGTLTIASRDGRMQNEIKHGIAYSRPAGVEHDVINETAEEIAFVEIEIKHRGGAD